MNQPVLTVAFFRTEAGGEPVRDWLRDLTVEDRHGPAQAVEEGIMNPHIGGNFDDFLDEDSLREEVTAAAVKRVIAWQFAQAMAARKISKTEMAARMRTSRMVVNRLLDEKDTSVTLATLARASVALGAPLRFELDAR